MSVEPQDGMAGVVAVRATAAETGDNEGILMATVEGDMLEIAFNVRYLIEVLNVIEQDRIVIETSSPSSPGVLRAVGDESFTHVIMPMHIGR
jgi:DNA polymerase-3 subunit beta